MPLPGMPKAGNKGDGGSVGRKRKFAQVSTLYGLNGRRHALSRQSVEAEAPNHQPPCPSGQLHAFLSSPLLSLPPPACLSQLPPPPHQAPRTPARLSPPPAPYLPAGPPAGPRGPLPGRSAREVPDALGSQSSRRTPHPGPLPGHQASPGHPGREVRAFLPPAPLQVTPARFSPGRGALVATPGLFTLPTGPGGGRRHTSPQRPCPAAERPEWRRSPRPAAGKPSPKGNKGPGSGPHSAKLALARSPPGRPTKPEPLPRAAGLAYPSVPARFLPEG